MSLSKTVGIVGIEGFSIKDLIDICRVKVDFSIISEKEFINLMMSRRPLELLLMAQAFEAPNSLSFPFKVEKFSGIESATIQELAEILKNGKHFTPSSLLTAKGFELTILELRPIELLLRAYFNEVQ